MTEILLIEDDRTYRRLVAANLEADGFSTSGAGSVAEAATAIEAHRPDVVVLDVGLPDGSGFDLCARLKADDATADIPVLLLTGLDSVEDKVRGTDAGADDFLTKGCHPLELRSRVRALSRIKSLADRVRAQNVVLADALAHYVSEPVARAVVADSIPAAGARREVSVLFVDIRGFTAYAEVTDPSEVLSVLNLHLGAVVGAVQNAGGFVDKFLGDGLMAVFGGLDDGNCHADRALAAALDGQAALARLGDSAFGVGMGIESGEAVVGDLGTAERSDFTVVGDAVNIASRLQELAVAGEVLVGAGAVAKSGIGAGHVFETLGSRSLRGRRTPLEVHRLIRRKEAAA